MNKFFYSKLAFTNVKNNAKFNIPYLITCMLSIIMFYTMIAITYNSQMERMPSHNNLVIIMRLGSIVVAIFSVIFLFYTNSFLMKRRKKEIGLYNILGMEKKHIAKILSIETLIMFVISLIGGLLCSLLFNKLIIMVLANIMQFDTVIKFEICGVAVRFTIILFGLIFLATLIFNLAKIQMAKPIELLHGGKVGEKEPKTKLIMTIIGVVCLSIAYVIANTVKSPLDALYLFFVAVILVIIGTYLLFITGSIAVLKLLKKNKKYYYQTKHFNSVSGMIYRMKQNAAGLANICILSTMVLVMISTTVSMYIGVDDALKYRYPSNISIYQNFTNEQEAQLSDTIEYTKNIVREYIENEGRKVEKLDSYLDFNTPCIQEGDNYVIHDDTSYYNSSTQIFEVIILDDYNALTGKNEKLKENEIIVRDPKDKKIADKINLVGIDFNVSKRVEKFPIASDLSEDLLTIHYIVVADKDVMFNIYNKCVEIFGDNSGNISAKYGIDIDGTDNEKIECYKKINTKLSEGYDSEKLNHYSQYMECRESNKQEFYSMYGSLLFLGIFLGILFLMATVLIIYYKQISEGYDDKERYVILQKVGMSKAEIKSTIKSQVLMVFFLPIIAAGIHVLAAFKMITKLLALMNLINVTLFAWCTLGTVIVFAIIYGIVYSLTARVYYKIVE